VVVSSNSDKKTNKSVQVSVMKMMKDERLSSQILIFISNSMVKVDYNHLKKQVISPKSH